jgi:hypothetical protein
VTTPVLPRRQRTSLSFCERRWLLSGRPGALYFLERAHVEKLWHKYADAIMARHIARYPGTRPANWWRFNAREPRRIGESQYEYLKRHGLLQPGEHERLRVRASGRCRGNGGPSIGPSSFRGQ